MFSIWGIDSFICDVEILDEFSQVKIWVTISLIRGDNLSSLIMHCMSSVFSLALRLEPTQYQNPLELFSTINS